MLYAFAMEPSRASTTIPDNGLLYDAFNGSPVGVAVENLEGQPLFVNPALCSMLGFSNQELLSKHCVDFSHPEDAEKDWALFQQLRAGSIDHYQMEKRYLRRDGSLLWGRLSISLFKGRPSPLVVAMVEEITDKKTAEQSLRASEERLRLAQQAARIGAFERNVRTGVVTWTPELEALYGLPPGGFGGTKTAFENLVHPDDLARLTELTDAGERTGQPTRGEWRVVWPDGSVHWIAGRWQVFKDDSGEPLRVFGVHVDITERKRAQEALLEVNHTLEAQAALLQSSEDLLKIFVKNVPVGVAIFDRDMRYLQVSDRWCADYFVDSSDVLGRSHYELFPDIPPRWKEMHRRGLDGETLQADEDPWNRGGGTAWVRWEIRPWRTPNGIVGGILIFAEDITHRKQMEETISGMSKKLIESQEQERARIGRELHDDINQRLPLLAVGLKQLRDNPSEVRSHLQDLLKQTTEISDDVQALSHDLDASKLEYLGALGGMRSWCREFAERQGIQIDFKSPEGRASVPRQIGLCLFRVLQEAVHNAAKYSGVQQVEVQLREGSGEVHLLVTDLGRGFDLETARQGRGLGLTSMQERVRLVNGVLEIRSTPMGGTTVHVRVPLASEPLNANAVV